MTLGFLWLSVQNSKCPGNNIRLAPLEPGVFHKSRLTLWGLSGGSPPLTARLAPECLDLLLYSQRALEVFRAGQVCRGVCACRWPKDQAGIPRAQWLTSQGQAKRRAVPGIGDGRQEKEVPKEIRELIPFTGPLIPTPPLSPTSQSFLILEIQLKFLFHI